MELLRVKRCNCPQIEGATKTIRHQHVQAISFSHEYREKSPRANYS